MSRDPLRVPDDLGHMLQAIQRIERFVQGLDEAGFLTNDLVQDAVIRNLEVIGEASRNIDRADPAFAARHPELPLKLAGDMRNALAHGYFKVDLPIVWKTVLHELPRLRVTVEATLNEVGRPGP